MYYDSDDEEFSVLDEISCEPIIETVDSDNEELYVVDEISYEPIVEMVDTKFTHKFMYNDAEELFPNVTVGAEPTSTTKDTEPDIQQPDPTCVQPEDTLHEPRSDTDSMMNDETSHKMCPDFLQGKE